MVKSDDFGDRFYAAEVVFPVPPDDESQPPSPEPPNKWQPSFSDLIAIGAIALAVILWIAQPGWRVGLPAALITVALFIFAAVRLRGPPLMRAATVIIATAAFLLLIWQPIWQDFEEKHPTFVASWFSGTNKHRQSPFDKTVQISCEWKQLPELIPPNGQYELELTDGPVGGAIVFNSGQPEAKASWSLHDAPNYAYRCRTINFGNSAVLNIETDLLVRYYEVVKTENGSRSGALLRSYMTVTPRMNLGTGSQGIFDFYARNYTPFYVNVTLPTVARAQAVGSDEMQDITLVQSLPGGFGLQPFLRD